MHLIRVLGVLCLLLWLYLTLGCQPAAPPPGPAAQPDYPRPLSVRQDGRNAQEWARHADVADEPIAAFGTRKLALIGPEAVPWMLDLIRESRFAHVRRYALLNLPAGAAQWHAHARSVVLAAQSDPDLMVRSAAASCAARHDWQR